MKSLSAIGQRLGTDKGDAAHSFQGVSFLDIYQTYFGPSRGLVRQVLEIGVLRGQSLRMWKEYFPAATVWGLDIDPATQIHGVPNLHTVCGSQIDPMALAAVAGRGPLDIVIDDGSHVVDHMLESLRLLWPRVVPGGFYVIEDTHATHEDVTQWRAVWPGQHLNAADTNFANSRGQFLAGLEAKIRDMDCLRGDCAFVHFWPRMVILRKALT